MIDEYLSGTTLLSITRELNDRGIPTPRGGRQWSRASVRHIVANPAHAGMVEQADGSLIEGQHHEYRLCELEEHHQIRARMERSEATGMRDRSVGRFLLRGVIRCGHCGELMNGYSPRGNNRRYYRCSTGRDRGARTLCALNSRPADLIEAAVLSQLRELAQDDEVQELAAGHLDEMVEDTDRRLREDVERLERKLQQLSEDYRFWSKRFSSGLITEAEYEVHRKGFLDENEEVEEVLEARREELRSSDQRAAELEQAHAVLGDFDATFDGLTPEQQQEMVHLLVADAQMLRREDGTTGLRFTVRAMGDFERVIPRLTGGDTKMTPQQMAVYRLFAQGLGRQEIAAEMDLSPQRVSQILSVGKRRVGAETREEAYEMVREEIEANADLLPTGRMHRKRTPDPNKPVLTPMQCRVLSLYGEGLKGPEIAERLGIGSDNTVYVHLSHIRDRLGRDDNDEAVKHAREMGYI